jgi:hypothetical protein
MSPPKLLQLLLCSNSHLPASATLAAVAYARLAICSTPTHCTPGAAAACAYFMVPAEAASLGILRFCFSKLSPAS